MRRSPELALGMAEDPFFIPPVELQKGDRPCIMPDDPLQLTYQQHEAYKAWEAERKRHFEALPWYYWASMPLIFIVVVTWVVTANG